MIKEFIHAFKGRHIFIKLKKCYPASNTLFMCMYDNDIELNKAVLSNICGYLERQYYKRLVFVCDSTVKNMIEEIIKSIGNFNTNYNIVEHNKYSLSCLIRFYKLQPINDFKLISFDEPFSNHLKNMLGYKGITMDILVNNSFLL